MKKLSKEQIEALKKKHGEIFEVEVDDKVCYLKRPTRKALSLAAAQGQRDPLKYNEVVLANCWVDGDEEIKTEDAYFLGVSGVLDQLIEVKMAALKKAVTPLGLDCRTWLFEGDALIRAHLHLTRHADGRGMGGTGTHGALGRTSIFSELR